MVTASRGTSGDVPGPPDSGDAPHARVPGGAVEAPAREPAAHAPGSRQPPHTPPDPDGAPSAWHEGFLWPPPGGDGLDWWIVRWVILVALATAGVAWLLVTFETRHAEIFGEIWSDGILLATAPDSVMNIVDWVPRRNGRNMDGSRFQGIELGALPVGEVYRGLSGQPLPARMAEHGSATNGVLRALTVSGHCLLRVDRAPGSALALTIRSRVPPDSGCVVNGELEVPPPAGGDTPEWLRSWTLVPIPTDTLTAAESAFLRFEPRPAQLPLRVERARIADLGYHSSVVDEPDHLVYGGVLRLPLDGDGDDQVYMDGRPLGRGHPIYLGDRVGFGAMETAEILRLDIGDTLHARFRATAAAPAIAGRSVKPKILQSLNGNNRLIWVLGLVLGVTGVVLSVFEAAR